MRTSRRSGPALGSVALGSIARGLAIAIGDQSSAMQLGELAQLSEQGGNPSADHEVAAPIEGLALSQYSRW